MIRYNSLPAVHKISYFIVKSASDLGGIYQSWEFKKNAGFKSRKKSSMHFIGEKVIYQQTDVNCYCSFNRKRQEISRCRSTIIFEKNLSDIKNISEGKTVLNVFVLSMWLSVGRCRKKDKDTLQQWINEPRSHWLSKTIMLFSIPNFW